MRKLYEIDKSIEDILNATTDPDTGELVDLESLDALLLEREQKIESVILYRKDVAAELTAVEAEIKTLKARKDRLEATRDGLDRYLTKALDGQKFSTAKCEATFRKSEVVDLDEFGFLGWVYSQPEDMSQYVIHKESDAPNKTEIKRLLKAGGTLPYCRLVEKQNLTIK